MFRKINEQNTKGYMTIESHIDYYDWVGFAFKNGDKEELKLEEFTGDPTEHQIIPFEREFVVR